MLRKHFFLVGFLFLVLLPPAVHCQWVELSNTQNPTCALTSGSNLFFASDSYILRSSNNGSTWEWADSGLSRSVINALGEYDGVIFAGTRDFGIFRSTDHGNSWAQANGGLKIHSAVAFVSKGASLFASTDSGVCHTTDDGLSWHTTSLKEPAICLAASEHDLFAGSIGIFHSSDDGVTWEKINSGLINEQVNALASRDSNLLAGTVSEGVLRSTDTGRTWTQVDYGLPHPNWTYSWVASLVFDGSNLFAGTYEGVFVSTDFAVNWDDVNQWMDYPQVHQLVLSGDYLIALTNGEGVWRRPVSEMILSAVKSAQIPRPHSYSIGQNYPNPFNPATTISYELPVTSYVTLQVFNLLGEAVATLVDDKRDPGRYTVTFDGSKHASGMYLYRIVAGEYAQTKKMLLMK